VAHFGGVAVGVDLAEVGGLNAEDFGFGLEESTSGVELLEGEVVAEEEEEEEEEVVVVEVTRLLEIAASDVAEVHE
jgi:hypothetical protein